SAFPDAAAAADRSCDRSRTGWQRPGAAAPEATRVRRARQEARAGGSGQQGGDLERAALGVADGAMALRRVRRAARGGRRVHRADRLIDMHVPVLLEETVALLCGRSDDVRQACADADEGRVREGIYVDATFGRGGHSRRLLARLGPDSVVIALDRDPEAVAAARALAEAEPRLTVRHGNFA